MPAPITPFQYASELGILYQPTYPFLTRRPLALPPLSRFLPFHLVHPITPWCGYRRAAGQGPKNSNSKVPEEEVSTPAF